MHISNSNLVMELSQLDETVEIYKKKAAVTDVASKDYLSCFPPSTRIVFRKRVWKKTVLWSWHWTKKQI